jgi:fumarate reductase subunit C
VTVRLYVLQRATAALMVPLIVIHLAVIFYATRQGLSAADILARTRGSFLWGGLYILFVVCAAVHGAIGIRAVAREWIGLSERALDALMWLIGVVFLVLGLRAVAAVVLS